MKSADLSTEPCSVSLWLMVFTLGCNALTGVAATPAALEVGDRKQLLIDRRFIAEEKNISLRINTPAKVGIATEDAVPQRRPLDIQMAVSREGLSFQRIERAPYIGLGLDGFGRGRLAVHVPGIHPEPR